MKNHTSARCFSFSKLWGLQATILSLLWDLVCFAMSLEIEAWSQILEINVLVSCWIYDEKSQQLGEVTQSRELHQAAIFYFFFIILKFTGCCRSWDKGWWRMRPSTFSVSQRMPCKVEGSITWLFFQAPILLRKRQLKFSFFPSPCDKEVFYVIFFKEGKYRKASCDRLLDCDESHIYWF